MYQRPLTSQELYHYGVIGMKWGVRRYQNPDGSLTAAGRRRYDVKERRAVKKERKKALKNVRTLSDDDIQKRINRLQMEKKMKDLTNDDIAPGRTAFKEALNKAGKVVTVAAMAGGLAYAGKTIIRSGAPVTVARAIVRTTKNILPKISERARVRNRVNEIFIQENVQREAKKVFAKENLEKWLDKINNEEWANYMFPNPNKKK